MPNKYKTMKRKEKLIQALRVAIDALQNETIFYNWQKQDSCNMGVVAQAILNVDAQAILNVDAQKLKELRQPLFNKLDSINQKRQQKKEETLGHTWKNAIQQGCPITGENLPKIIKRLEECGMTRADMVHLEYLENPAILKLSGIQQVPTQKRIQVDTIQKQIPAGWLGILGLLGIKKTIQEPVYEIKTTYQYPEHYYAEKENVIKYLSAWLSILLDENMSIKHDENKHLETELNLERELLLAVVNEDYEKAATLRDKITKHKLTPQE